MMQREPVDFVVGDDPAAEDTDEDLVEPPRRWPAGRLPWALAAAAAIAAVVLVVVNRADDGGTYRAASPLSSAVAVAPAPGVTFVFTPQVEVTGSPLTRLPEGNRRPRQPDGCPSGAECYADTAVPIGVLTALRADFPSAQLTSAYSVLANRAQRFQPDLVSRLMHVRAGSIDVTVMVRKPQRADHDRYRRERTGPMLLHSVATHAGSAFTVTVEIMQYGRKHTPSRRTLERLAREPDLVAPQ